MEESKAEVVVSCQTGNYVPRYKHQGFPSLHIPVSGVTSTHIETSAATLTIINHHHHQLKNINRPVRVLGKAASSPPPPHKDITMPPIPLLRSVSVPGQPVWKREASEDTPSNNSSRVWIIVAAVAALLALGASIALVAISLSRRRLVKQQLEEARQRDPCLGQKEFSRRRRMTREDLVLEAEGQREAMIHKSLASRSGRSISTSSGLTFDQRSAAERSGRAGSSDGYGLDDDKSWEGRLSRPTSPASSLRRARSSSPFPDLPAPTHSRPSSPNRLAQAVVGRPELPPLLERHPLFQNAHDDSEEDEVFRPAVMRTRAGTKEG